jgi:hypothetical protein
MLVRTRLPGQRRFSAWLLAAFPREPGGLRGSTDVICGIRATARQFRPQPKRRSSTIDRAAVIEKKNKPESDSLRAAMVNFSFNG